MKNLIIAAAFTFAAPALAAPGVSLIPVSQSAKEVVVRENIQTGVVEYQATDGSWVIPPTQTAQNTGDAKVQTVDYYGYGGGYGNGCGNNCGTVYVDPCNDGCGEVYVDPCNDGCGGAYVAPPVVVRPYYQGRGFRRGYGYVRPYRGYGQGNYYYRQYRGGRW